MKIFKLLFILQFVFLFANCDNPDPKEDPIKVEMNHVYDTYGSAYPGEILPIEINITSEKDVKTTKTIKLNGKEIKTKEFADVPITFYLVDKKESDNNAGSLLSGDGSNVLPRQLAVDTQIVQIKSGFNTYKFNFKINDKLHVNDEPVNLTGNHYVAAMIDPAKMIKEIDHDDNNDQKLPGKKMYKNTNKSVEIKEVFILETYKSTMLKSSSNNLLSIVDDIEKENTKTESFKSLIENFPSVEMFFDNLPEYKTGNSKFEVNRFLDMWVVAPDGDVYRISSGVPDYTNPIKQEMDIDKDKKLKWEFIHQTPMSGYDMHQAIKFFNSPSMQPSDGKYFIGRTIVFPNAWNFDNNFRKWFFSKMSAGKSYNFRIAYTVGSVNGTHGKYRVQDYASSYKGTGTHPNHKYVTFSNWAVKYEKIEKISYSNKNRYGNKYIALASSFGQMNTRNVQSSGLAGEGGARFNFNSDGEFGLELFGHTISLMSLQTHTKSQPKSEEKNANGDSNGHIESSWGIDFSWDPTNSSINVGITKDFPISSVNKEIFAFEFQAGPVPIAIVIYAGYNITIKFNIGASFPTDSPFYPSFHAGFGFYAGAYVMITGGVGSSYFNIGVYGKLTLIDAGIGYEMALSPKKDDDGKEISPRQYGQITQSLNYKMQLLSGELGFQATVPWIEWCCGVIPCGITKKIFTYPLFTWNGICALGNTDNGGCEAKTLELAKVKW